MIAKVDCDANPKLAEEANVTKLPDFEIWRQGSEKAKKIAFTSLKSLGDLLNIIDRENEAEAEAKAGSDEL